MHQTDPAATPAAPVPEAERRSLLQEGSAPVAIALLLALPLAIWAAALISALLVSEGGA